MFGKKQGEELQSASPGIGGSADSSPFGSGVPVPAAGKSSSSTGDAFPSLSTAAGAVGGHHYTAGAGHANPHYRPDSCEYRTIVPFGIGPSYALWLQSHWIGEFAAMKR